MAATIASAQGFTKDGSPKGSKVTRLGHGHVTAEANTYRTFARVTTWADGRVDIEIRRDDALIAELRVNEETADTNVTEFRNAAREETVTATATSSPIHRRTIA